MKKESKNKGSYLFIIAHVAAKKLFQWQCCFFVELTDRKFVAFNGMFSVICFND